MDELRQTKINQLVGEHNLSSEIIGRCVGADGIVDHDKLGVVLQTQAFTRNNITVVNQAEIERLQEAYYEAQDRRDWRSMTRITSRIYELGGRLGPRKKV